MRRTFASAMLLVVTPLALSAQDADRKVEGGGIKLQGWAGRIDARAASQGMTINDARLEGKANNSIHVVTGPAATYWNPANKATGEYTVSATFREPEFMSLNDHAHPYGIVVAGNALDSDAPKYLYCAAYGNGRFIVRGFGPQPFQLNGRGETHAAINKASAKGVPVTQEVAVTVRNDRVECSVNGQVVGTYPKSQVIGEGKLSTTDGIYGIRIGHNAEAEVTGLKVVPVR